MSTPVDVIESTVRDLGLEYQRATPESFVVALPGEHRLRTACWLTVGAHALEVEAFVMRRPDENHEKVYAALLHRNARMYGVAWCIDAAGDVYLVGRVPLAAVTPDEVDRVLGCVLEYADGAFNSLLELGFASSIRREWAWRVKNDEPLTNLAPFAHLAEGSQPSS